MFIVNFLKKFTLEEFILALILAFIAGLIIDFILKGAIKKFIISIFRRIKKLLSIKKFEKKYRNWLVERYKFLQVRGIKTNAPVAIELEHVFVSLKTKKHSDRMPITIFKSAIEGIKDEETVIEESIKEEFIERKEEYETEKTYELKDLFNLPQKRFIIIGAPGSGKTTLLSYFALKFARKDIKKPFGIEDEFLPIFVNLRDTATGGFLDVRRFAENYDSYIECSHEPPGDFFKKKLNEGKCIILLDGLDEVASVEQRIKVANWVDELATAYSKNIFIATSRPYGYESAHLYNDFLELHILDFTPEQVKKFIEYWTKAVEIKAKGDESDFTLQEAKKRAEDLLKAIEENPKIEVLTVNPLLLTIVSLVHRYRAALPKRRVELYEECCDVLLGYWDTAKGLAGELQPRQKRTVLQPLAFYLHQKGLREEKREKFIELLENELPKIGVSKEKAGDFLNNIKERCGVLVETRIDHFGFTHLTFQEFLTARHILDNELENFLVAIKRDKYWLEVTLLYCGMKDTTKLLTKILKEPEDIFHTNLFLAGRCLAESLSVSPELRNELTEELYKIYWDEKEFQVSNETSLEILREIKDQRIIQKLIEETRAKDSYVRWRAAYALGQIQAKEAVAPLIELLKDKESDVQSCAVVALGKMHAKEAINPLIELIRDKEIYVKHSVAYALDLMQAKEAVLPLIELLKNKQIEVRRITAYILGRMQATEGIFPLTELLKDKELEVRGYAAYALGELHNKEAILPLIELLKDKELFVRGCAAYALGQIQATEAFPSLIELLKEKEVYFKEPQSYQLVKIDGEERLVILHVLSTVRQSAAYALNKIQPKEAVLVLVELLKDKKSLVRGNAASSLGEIQANETVPILTTLLRDNETYVREKTALALGRMKAAVAVSLLIQLLKDNVSNVREKAAWALGTIRAQEAVSSLIELLKDKETDVRASAAFALSQIQAQKAIPSLIELLKDKESDVRGRAAYALGQIKSENAVIPLIELLRDKESNVRERAADALGQIGDKKAVESLKLLLNDPVFDVRESAFRALKEISERTNTPIYKD